MPSLLALDFGGTKHSAGLIEWPLDLTKPLLWKAYDREYSPAGANAKLDLEIMFRLAHSLLQDESPRAIGVSFGGPVTASTNVVKLSHHVAGWENIPLGQLLTQEFDCPVQVDNDANTAALGEQRFGAGKGCQSLVYITVSTGIGSGLIIDQQIWHGFDSMAGEIGHTVIDPRGPICLCGKRGCVERFASGAYLTQDVRLRLHEKSSQSSIILDLASGDPQAVNGEVISRAAQLGDHLALEYLERAAWALGTGIGNMANLFNPERFILGGGVTKSGELFWQVICQTARQVALPEVSINILPAALGDDAPLWGAIALAAECL